MHPPHTGIFKPPPRSGPSPPPSLTLFSPVLIPSSASTDRASPPPATQHEDHAEGAVPGPGLGKKHYVLAGQIGSPGASMPASDDEDRSDVEYRRHGPRQASSAPPPGASRRSA